jgi:hypothetical protein
MCRLTRLPPFIPVAVVEPGIRVNAAVGEVAVS